MENYTFIFRDSFNHWCTATSIVFIAKHTMCRAIPTEDILKEFKTIREFIKLANEYPMHEKAYEFISNSVLREIY